MRTRRTSRRKQSAFSLAAMFMIALLVGLTISGMGAALIPYYRSNATDALAELQTSAISESAANYVLGLLSDPDSRDTYDAKIDSPLRVINLSATDLGIAAPTSDNIKRIKVLVQYQSPQVRTLPSGTSALYFPIAYDPKFDPASPDRFQVIGNTNFWRTMTVLVEYGSTGAKPYWKGTVVTLKPFIKPTAGGLPPDSSIFDTAAFGRNSVTLAANASTNSFFDPLTKTPIPDFENKGYVGGNVGAGKTVSLGDNSKVGGKIQIDSKTPAVIDLNPTAKINEVIQYNSSNEGVAPVVQANTSNGLPAPEIPDLLASTVSKRGATTPYTNPVIDTNLPINDIPSLAAPDGTLSFNLSTTTAPAAGDYVIDSSQLSQANLTNIPNPIRLFVESSSSSDEALTISQNIGNSSAPGNLQIFYSGTRPLNFTGSTVSALVFAPSSRVTFGNSAGLSTTLIGSIRAGDVVVQNQSKVSFYNAVASPSFGNGNVGYNMKNLDISNATGANSLRWEIQTVKELNRTEFLAASQLAP
jgi:hypothetical protein